MTRIALIAAALGAALLSAHGPAQAQTNQQIMDFTRGAVARALEFGRMPPGTRVPSVGGPNQAMGQFSLNMTRQVLQTDQLVTNLDRQCNMGNASACRQLQVVIRNIRQRRQMVAGMEMQDQARMFQNRVQNSIQAQQQALQHRNYLNSWFELQRQSMR